MLRAMNALHRYLKAERGRLTQLAAAPHDATTRSMPTTSAAVTVPIIVGLGITKPVGSVCPATKAPEGSAMNGMPYMVFSLSAPAP